jgi:hypothetical protein
MIQFYIEKAPMRASCGAFLRLLSLYYIKTKKLLSKIGEKPLVLL